ncbi:MAG: pilus assembly protein CpaE [Alphaproteobacteria bacterium]|nr:pilus assembly protein CpaE [Alphaproteobacteria bacterium]
MNMTAKLDATGREAFAAYVADDTTQQTIIPIVEGLGWNSEMVFSGGIASAVRALGAMPCPEFLIVDLSGSTDPRADMQALADVAEEGTLVLAIGDVNDVTLYRDLIHAGVFDYLVKPLTGELLQQAILSAQDALVAAEDGPEQHEDLGTKQIVCVGVRGGLGTSAIATNLAWLLAEHKKEPTAILDLDLYFGTSAMQFDLEPGRGLSDALDNPNRVDGLFLERAVVKPHERLSILAAEAPVGALREPVDGALEQLVTALGENYTNVVVDVPRQMLGDHADVLLAATDIVLVTDFSLAAARDCIRMLAHIKQQAPRADVYVVADKVGMVPNEVEEKDFENSIEHAVDVKIPFDPKSAMAAAQKGTVVAEDQPTGKLASAYKELLHAIHADDADADKQKSWLDKLLKK